MKIKNIYTNSKKEVIDFLLRYLCINGISYVMVSNEIHFLDNIYRFYDIKDISLDSTLEKIFATLDQLEISQRLNLSDELFVKETISEERIDNTFQIPDCKINKKRLIKMQNRQSNLRLKNSR